MAKLIHTIYASKSLVDMTQETILPLLSEARKKNKRLGVTGILLFDQGTFFQVIEGEAPTIERLFNDISKDPRHGQIVTIISEAIPHRQFGQWSMGFPAAERNDLRTIEGMNDFFDQASCLSKIDPGRAKKLLKAFAQGRWRID